MKTGAVIVAAGLSSRMGEFKAMLPFENTTIARHIVKSVQNAGADPVVMVTGYPIRPQTMIRLARDEAFFGPGKAQLIEYIDRTGSIQEACQEMGISYTKGSNMIKDAEKELGFKLLERWSGGTSGGGSRMTKEAKEFLRCYWEMVKRAQNLVDELFKEYFSEDIFRE